MAGAVGGWSAAAVPPAALPAALALHPAATKPAVLVLAANTMLTTGLAATIVWQCTAWCSAATIVPEVLAGKQLA